MELRRCKNIDLPEIARLFFDTINAVCAENYTKQQIDAWSGRWQSLLSRGDFLSTLYTIVAVENGIIIGYGNISNDGYIDHLYTHKDYQHMGVATAICDELEKHAHDIGVKRFTVHASKTALPFFISRGYRIISERQTELDGVKLTNYLCEKTSGLCRSVCSEKA